jgi:hypothetical protein
MLRYEHSVEMKRRPWQRRIEVFSPKLMRRISLYSRDAHDAWLLLESNPRVDSFCERPAYLKGEAGRILDFWIRENRKETFWIIEPPRVDSEPLPKFVHGRPLRVLTRPDMIAFAMRIENWAQIVPYRISFVGQTERRLKKDICVRLEKPQRLEGIEAAFQPLDVSVVRAALFELLAEGEVVAPELDIQPLGLGTVFRRSAA